MLCYTYCIYYCCLFALCATCYKLYFMLFIVHLLHIQYIYIILLFSWWLIVMELLSRISSPSWWTRTCKSHRAAKRSGSKTCTPARWSKTAKATQNDAGPARDGRRLQQMQGGSRKQNPIQPNRKTWTRHHKQKPKHGIDIENEIENNTKHESEHTIKILKLSSDTNSNETTKHYQ